MALFTLKRSISRELSDVELEMIQVRAISTAWYEPQYLWQRSFGWEEETTLEGFCVYSGPGSKDLAWQQRICGVPFEQIDEVEEIPGAHSGPGIDYPGEGKSLFYAERVFESGMAAVWEANSASLSHDGDVTWLRSFWNEPEKTSKCIFAARSEAAARDRVTMPGSTLGQFKAVNTNHPSLWSDTYDRLGLARHWEIAAAPV
jgi:hypothetical protein